MSKTPTLEMPESYKNATSKQKAKICNGVGADFFPQWLIDALNTPAFCYGISLRECANIHDWMYYYGKTEQDKIKADKTFGRNMLATIKFYSWCWRFNPLYYLRRMRTKECYLAVRLGGDRAFWSGKEKVKRNNNIKHNLET